MSVNLEIVRKSSKKVLATFRVPQRPYASYAAYLSSAYFWKPEQTNFPCVACRAYGWVYDPNDPPDPIEGNKLRNRLKCPGCKGTKYGERKDSFREYNLSVRKWKQELEAHREVVRRFVALCEKLTDEDVTLFDAVRKKPFWESGRADKVIKRRV